MAGFPACCGDLDRTGRTLKHGTLNFSGLPVLARHLCTILGDLTASQSISPSLEDILSSFKSLSHFCDQVEVPGLEFKQNASESLVGLMPSKKRRVEKEGACLFHNAVILHWYLYDSVRIGSLRVHSHPMILYTCGSLEQEGRLRQMFPDPKRTFN